MSGQMPKMWSKLRQSAPVGPDNCSLWCFVPWTLPQCVVTSLIAYGPASIHPETPGGDRLQARSAQPSND
jgi:hypothetical protein